MSKAHLVTFVLDETSSMMPRKSATISGFNEWMMEMEKFPGEVLFTMVKFNTDKHELAYKQALLGDDQIRLSEASYRPAAATPLYDAIGRAIRATEDVLSEREDDPSVTFVILTDGEENSSTEWNIDTIKQLIEEKEKEEWTFTYMGVTQDAWQGGFDLGIGVGNIMASPGDSVSVSNAMAANAQATTRHLRSGGGLSSSYYAEETEEDGSLIQLDTIINPIIDLDQEEESEE
jgi:hypothetical protein